MNKRAQRITRYLTLLAVCLLLVLMPRTTKAADNRKSQRIQAENITVTVGKKAAISAKSSSSRTYTSQNTSIATVSKTGQITGKKVGTTYITIKAIGTKKYKSATKKIKVTVKADVSYVVLHDNQGNELRRIQVNSKKAVTLPSIADPEGYTFVGWSKTPKVIVSDSNQVTPWSPGYVMTNIQSTVKLYAVLSQNSAERDMAISSIARLNTSKYSHLILVGDSRTEHAKKLLTTRGYDVSHVSFISRGGATLDWLQSNGYDRLIRQVRAVNQDPSRPVAVVFNMGVNDLRNLSLYLVYMKRIAPELQAMNCRLFYMSVNPYNSEQIRVSRGLSSYGARKDEELLVFNRAIQRVLASDYTYINTCSYLYRAGYSSDSFTNGVMTGLNDGLHFTERTYKRIMHFAVNYINKN